MLDRLSDVSSAAADGRPGVPVAAPDALLKLLQAMAEPLRWAVLGQLATGQRLSVQELGARLQRRPNLVSKHLRVLREAGAVVVVPSPDADGRKQFYTVPEAFRHIDEAGRPVLDYGVCALRAFPVPAVADPATSANREPARPEPSPPTAGLDMEHSGWID
jgi:DNA-binding transcriptional ArsR family regulator